MRCVRECAPDGLVCVLNGFAEVSCASTWDPSHPPPAVLSEHRFWLTTGLFPQHIVFSFHDTVHVLAITIDCTSIRRLRFRLASTLPPQPSRVSAAAPSTPVQTSVSSKSRRISITPVSASVDAEALIPPATTFALENDHLQKTFEVDLLVIRDENLIVVLEEGYGDFAVINKLTFEGMRVHAPTPSWELAASA